MVGVTPKENQSVSKVRVFGETLGNHIRELIVGRAVNETNDAGGDVGFDVVLFHVNVYLPLSLTGKNRS